MQTLGRTYTGRPTAGLFYEGGVANLWGGLGGLKTMVWKEQTPFVGRDREVSTLAGLLEEARRGHGGVVLVARRAGDRQNRLLLEFAQRARAGDWHVLLGRAYDSEGMPPYLPLIEALHDYLRTCRPIEVRAHLDGIAPDLLRLLPDIVRGLAPSPSGPRAPSPVRPRQDPEGERYRLFESVRGVLLNVARSSSSGLLLCLDDLHWADPPTLQLLLHVARKLGDAPVLVVCSYRSAASGGGQPFLDALAELSREWLRQRVDLNPLSQDELGSLVTSLGGTTARAVVQVIHGQTGGNPFFARELVRHLQDQGHDLHVPMSRPPTGACLPACTRSLASDCLG